MSRSRTRSGLAALAAIAAAVTVAGCGFGAGPGTKDASIQVTSDFGSHLIGRAVERHVPGAETVMSLLERHFKVTTRYGGGFAESIDGHSGGSSHLDWFYYVNGIEAPQGAAATDVHKGDHIWWDLHDWAATDSVPAVVGSYPEPFTNGIGGKEFPTLLELRARRAGRLRPHRRRRCTGPASRPPTRCSEPGPDPTRWPWWSAPGARSRT